LIFVDTSFWVALINRRDPRHKQAAALLAAHADERLLTTNEVRGETWTFLRRRAGHAAAVRFLDTLSTSPRAEILRVTQTIEANAELWLRCRDDREFSWVDATSFAAMRERRMTLAFAFDGDFAAAGLTELRT
jgi:predicted nucleic acid-binding protein